MLTCDIYLQGSEVKGNFEHQVSFKWREVSMRDVETHLDLFFYGWS